ncbi:MAG: CDP-alcohol phosphatidyltransferase family protein [Candidatus Omnitrophica bacterium]|nr:CDP-alcohol phosphatidyltransferase family protein [Candidatus Omnitrophota bacterium]
MLRNLIGKKINKPLRRTASFLHDHKITPNILTFTGLVMNAIAGYCYYKGFFVEGGIIILCAGLFDMLDGAVARVGNTVTKIGAFTDSVVDRYSDLLIFGGLLLFFSKHGNLGGSILLLAVMSGAYLVSYIRARAELVIPQCAVGLMERPERIILLAVGSIASFLTVALWILAIGTHLTALYRIYYTFKKSQEKK